MPLRPASRPVRWSSWLVWGMVVAIPRSAQGAEPSVAALTTALGLVGYPSSTTPPPFDGVIVDARRISTAALRGRVVLVNFWASWYLECRPELPVIERLHRELWPRGLVVVGINARESKDAVARYAAEHSLTLPLVLDPEGKIGALYGVVGLPATFLVGRDGRAVAFAIGSRQWGGAPARTLLDTLLAEPVPQQGPQ